ncbi:MAG: hypothetical protein M3416_19140 [Acidobacteriota bacterium]|nr:hypothetical protein [Acidobacteriota bacterium]
MSDWIGLGIFVLVVAGAVAGLSYLGRPRKPMSNEEFEQRAAEARGTMSAGVAGLMYALQKLMNPKAAEAVEVQKDLRAGYYDDKEHAGEGDDEPEDKRSTTETR